jgi:hypothetical protein
MTPGRGQPPRSRHGAAGVCDKAEKSGSQLPQNEKTHHHSRCACSNHWGGFCSNEMHLLQGNRVGRQLLMPGMQRNREMADSPVKPPQTTAMRPLPEAQGGDTEPCPQSFMEQTPNSKYAQSHPFKRSSQVHAKVDLIRAKVAKGGKYSPASRLCQYRVLRPVLSAICSCVNPARPRISETFRPKRSRSRQGVGFLEGMFAIVSKINRRQHEALPRPLRGCIPEKVRWGIWATEITPRQQSHRNRDSICKENTINT